MLWPFLSVFRQREVKLSLKRTRHSVCQALHDDYQCVREVALNLIKVAAMMVTKRLVPIHDSDHHVRLVDHAFSQICNMVNDISVRVRTKAASLLGNMTSVSERFLAQTLDKKLMSNMRNRPYCTYMNYDFFFPTSRGNDHAHERARAMVASARMVYVEALGQMMPQRAKSRQTSRQSIPVPVVLSFNGWNDDFLGLQSADSPVHITLRVGTSYGEICLALKGPLPLISEELLPQDRRSIHRCLRRLGSNHPILVEALVPQLLLIHPYFDGVEPSVQDGEYICKLILVLNAAVHCPTIVPLLEQHTLRHYAYLRDTMPQLVPVLKLGEDWQPTGEAVATNTLRFLRESMEKVANLERSSTQMRLTIYQIVHSDLVKLADIDPELSPAAHFAALYTQCMWLFNKILSTRNWLTPSSLSVQQSGALKSNVDQLLRNTFRLRHAFTNLSPQAEASIRNLRVRTLALQLVYVVHGSTGSALGLCDNFLEHTEALHRYLTDEKLSGDSFLETVFEELSQLEEPRPGAVARILQPLLISHPVPALSPITNPREIRMCSAEILEPQPDSEVIYKLSAGLVVGVPLDAEVSHIPNPSTLRIRVAYPDHSTHLVVPPKSHLRKVGPGTYRLLTTVLVSAQVSWSEACQVGLSLVLDLSDQEVLAARRHSVAKADDSATTIQLVKPVKVLVWPKVIRKGV
ncbi:integrator complex subunit 4-like [Penaeus monodon]|uniref:integrator complex subunit 4-like n=1 Tax=Penaeus monodon TaxID=6687 RepID=UPI0018A77401|nr:integrator complex subunit 4-like [Penaeus monodon]